MVLSCLNDLCNSPDDYVPNVFCISIMSVFLEYPERFGRPASLGIRVISCVMRGKLTCSADLGALTHLDPLHAVTFQISFQIRLLQSLKRFHSKIPLINRTGTDLYCPTLLPKITSDTQCLLL